MRVEKIPFLLFFRFGLIFLLFSSVFLLSSSGQTAQVTLTWDPNTEPDLAGYDIYYGTSSGNYQSKTDVGNVTTYTLNGLNIGVTYYLAATAYNAQGLESGFSNEVIYTVPSCTYTISPSSASFSTSGGSGSVTVTTQAGCSWVTSTAPSWITVNSGSGTGTGTMSYTVSSNTGTTRTASLTIAGNVFTVTEAGATTYLITASAGAGGSISPSGQISVQQGAGKTFTITPNSGYVIADVKVDGVSKGKITSYTFSAVNANHTIAASFTPSASSYTLTISKTGTGSGTVSSNPAGTSFSAGTVVTLTASPDANSIFGGWSGACSGTSTTCQVTMNSNVNVTATFNLKTYTITASAGTGGSISPSAGINVQSGSNQTFTVTPNSGYQIANVTVDGVSKGAISSYTFSSVSANHTITASFTPICFGSYILTISKNRNRYPVVSPPTLREPSFSAGTGCHLDRFTECQFRIRRVVRCLFRDLNHLPSNHELQSQCDGNLLSRYQGTGSIHRLSLVCDF